LSQLAALELQGSIVINQSYYLAHRLPTDDGYTWTLASRLGAMLQEIEVLYNERDKSWTFVGVEFEASGPQNWFPGNCKNVAIQLNTNALNDNVLACYQLAHECIHLLAPDGKRGAPVLEEGLATVYSEDFIAKYFGAEGYTNMESYQNAAALVRDLISSNPDAIKKLRTIEPSFKQMTLSTFLEAEIDFPEQKIIELLETFERE
jgi:hypothetical protein